MSDWDLLMWIPDMSKAYKGVLQRLSIPYGFTHDVEELCVISLLR